jgi:hypothetical protein
VDLALWLVPSSSLDVGYIINGKQHVRLASQLQVERVVTEVDAMKESHKTLNETHSVLNYSFEQFVAV